MQPTLDDLKLGCLIVFKEEASPLPLEQTTVSGQIIGPVASVTVTQQFGNPFKDTVELQYLFPLPHEAAVVDYEITIGSRVIKADMKELEAARRAYQQAVDEGKHASLLEQRRPNLFSIQIGNVRPGEKIITALRYQERLHYSDDSYEFIFPMGITPKFHANKAEAANVDSPVAQAGETISGVSLSLIVDAGALAGDPTSPSHKFDLTRQDERRFSIKLAEGYIPNKDFVLRYPVAADAIRAASWTSKDSDADTVLVSILPPRLTSDTQPAPREFIFVIDRSGSMSSSILEGREEGPIVQARNALRACLRALGSQDTFTIQAFDDKVEWFNPKAQPITQDNVNAADQWLNGIDARGGTDILSAIDAALAIPADKERQRYVVFLTDGAVSADDQALAKLKKQRGTARIFTFGIGPSVNRSLLNKMAQLGRGIAEFLQLTEDIEDAITRFQDRVSYPVLQDIQLDWQGAEAWDVYPVPLPDLYIGQPLEVTARLKRTGSTTLKLQGQRQGKPVSLTVPLPAAETADPTLKRIWARARVDALLNSMDDAPNVDAIRQQIIGLALDNRLLTPYTAFVAVDSEAGEADKSKDGPRKVNVSVPLPEGLNMDGFFDPRARGIAGMAFTGGAPMYRLMAAPPPASPAPRQAKASGGLLKRVMRRSESTRQPEEDLEADYLMAAPASAPIPQAEPTPILTTIPERLKWLARTQNVSGSWGSESDEVEMTAAALLAFVRAGHTTRAGNYRQQVRKAANWLKAAQASGFAAFAKHRALSELDAATQHADQYASNAKPTTIPTNDAERAALNVQPFAMPMDIASLDDLRVRALAVGNVVVHPDLFHDAQHDLAQVWLAVGQPA
ncbi:MAG: VWA domain-containing protein [Anaerolineae bacterium]|nr:VWA domain-containing protein [Anaerolineae bacterium]